MGRSLQSKYFLSSRHFFPSSPFHSDLSLVDFYLNLICKKSPRVAIVIVVVSATVKPSPPPQMTKRTDSIVFSREVCTKKEAFYDTRFDSALIANDFSSGTYLQNLRRASSASCQTFFPSKYLWSIEIREQRTWNIFGDRDRNRERSLLTLSPPPKSISTGAARDETTKPAPHTIRAIAQKWLGWTGDVRS